jgi:Fe-S-cluster-containing hydrogenase component 2
MIFYFSGTGNSFHVATEVAKSQGQLPVSIAKELDKGTHEYQLNKNELVGFIYPIYAWGPPKIVLDFIRKIKINGEKPYVFSISTCGSNEGNATHLLQKALRLRGLSLDSAFSLVMPGNYVIGQDICSKDEAEKILKSADERLKAINDVIEKRQTGVFQLISGSNAFLHTDVINPLFNRFARSTKNFYATDVCTHCHLCEKICPVHSITVREKPMWSKDCTQCLACINRCPVKAIQYGTHTADRGRYVFPNE